MSPPDPAAAAGRPRRVALAAATALVSLVLVLVVGEALLRAAGRGPWRRAELPGAEPVMHEPDAELGWRNRPGSYVYPGYAPGAPDVRVTYLADGSRDTGFRGEPGAPEVWLAGDSFMQGWGLSDDETLAWRLQARYPELRFVNLGTGGYGTWQTLLRLERALAERPPPRLVVYGFIPAHERRNVASVEWLRDQARAARSGMLAVPFATLAGDGSLVRHPPQAYPRWPLDERSALVAFAQDLFARAGAARRSAEPRRTTQAMLREMQALCAAHGTRLAVLFFWIDREGREDYAPFLRASGAGVVNCARPVTPDLVIPGEGHPNGRLNALWADCVSRRIPLAGLVP
jgi:hypothetical protein